MAKFKVGDVCLVVDPTGTEIISEESKKMIGRECTIMCINPTAANYMRMRYRGETLYQIEFSERTDRWYACESCLRKKEPPREALGSWEIIAKYCEYQRPVEVTA